MKLIGHMSLTRDPNAPAEPTYAQRREAQADLEVIAAKKLVDIHTKNIFPPSEQRVSRTSTRVRRSLPVRLHRSIFQRTRSPCEVTVSLTLSHSPGMWTSSIFNTFPKSRHSIVPTLLALWKGLFSRMQIISRITLCRNTASRILVDLELLEFEGFGEVGGAVGSTPKIATVECKSEQLRPEQEARASIIMRIRLIWNILCWSHSNKPSLVNPSRRGETPCVMKFGQGTSGSDALHVFAFARSRD